MRDKGAYGAAYNTVCKGTYKALYKAAFKVPNNASFTGQRPYHSLLFMRLLSKNENRPRLVKVGKKSAEVNIAKGFFGILLSDAPKSLLNLVRSYAVSDGGISFDIGREDVAEFNGFAVFGVEFVGVVFPLKFVEANFLRFSAFLQDAFLKFRANSGAQIIAQALGYMLMPCFFEG